MLRVTAVLFASFIIASTTSAQEEVLSYPFEWKPGVSLAATLENVQEHAYIADHTPDTSFCIALRNNRTIEYLQLDKKDFRVLRSIAPGENALFQVPGGQPIFSGATGADNKYYFIYSKDKRYFVEKVDFATKQSSHAPLLTLDKNETFLTAFNHNNTHYLLSCTKEDQMNLYCINNQGELSQKSFTVNVPDDLAKKAISLSEYLKDCAVIDKEKTSSYNSLSSEVKVFREEDLFYIAINKYRHGTRLITISLPGFAMKDQEFDYGHLNAITKEKGTQLGCFINNNRLYTTIATSDSYQIAIHDLTSRQLLNIHEINENTDLGTTVSLARELYTNAWESKGKDIPSSKKLLQLFKNRSPWINVSKNNEGQEVVTAGAATNYLYRSSTGGSMLYDQVYFIKKVIDPTTFTPASGTYNTLFDRRVSYISTIKFRKVRNLFYLGNTAYFGYFNHELKRYIIERLDME